MDLSQLNPAQHAAVTAPDGPHLVVAGAGTGKTRTLVHRVAWLVEQGVPPRAIVLLTFTRRAAGEMLERAVALSDAAARQVRGGTFHAFGSGLLRRYAPVLGYTSSYTILDRGDAESLVGLLRGELQLGGKGRRFAKSRTLLDVISKSINTAAPIAEVLDEEYPQYLEDAADIERLAALYAERKRKQDVMDYDDLLVRTVELLRDHPRARHEIASACRYVLVDEFQDTNRLQGQIAALLSVVHGNLMVVGDEAQSIYGFRGAWVRNILDFPQLYPECRQTVLEHNYRSVQPILDLANGVLESATEHYEKHLFSELPGDLPALVDLPTDEDQPGFVVREVLKLREEGVPLQEIAVLSRSAWHGNLLEVELTRANLPYRKFGGIRFTEAAHVKDVFALLRIVANPRDALAWFRVLQWGEGIGATTAQRIADGMVAAEVPVLDPAAWRKKRYHGFLVDLVHVLEDATVAGDDLDAQIEVVLRGYRKKMPDLYEDVRKREKDLETIALLATGYPDLQAFLAEVALDPVGTAEVAPDDGEDEWLTLSTIHSAKGLEWNTVFVLQLGDGHFPSGYAVDTDEAMEEERRLFYVAVTRAKRRLYLLRPRFLRSRWGMGAGPGCALLDEIPNLDALVEPMDGAPPPEPEAEKHPDLKAAEDRLKRFMEFYRS